jgi:hypothetical protein
VAYTNEFNVFLFVVLSGDRIPESDVYLSLKSLFTKSVLAELTTPFLRMLRLRFFDFLVRMWRLNAFWKVISPVPVTLNLFLALEFVLTFGIFTML